MTFEEWKNEHLCDDDVQLIDLCEDAYQAGERANEALLKEKDEEIAELKEDYKAIMRCGVVPVSLLNAAEQKVVNFEKVLEFYLTNGHSAIKEVE